MRIRDWSSDVCSSDLRVLVATGAPPELARAILDFVAHEGLPVIGSLGKPFLGGFITDQHCHAANKMRMIHAAGYAATAIAYPKTRADLPLLQAPRHTVGARQEERLFGKGSARMS